MCELTGQMTWSDLAGWSGRTFPAPCQAQENETEKTSPAKISAPSLKKRQGSAIRTPLFLDLRGSGRRLEPSWETDGASLGEYMTHSFGESPSVAAESRLSQILEEQAHPKYSLSARACQGILNRAERRGKELPEELKKALENQSLYRGVESTETSDKTEPDGRKELATASQAQTGTAYAFMGGQGSKAGSIGYGEEIAPSLKSVPSGGNTVPDVMACGISSFDSNATSVSVNILQDPITALDITPCISSGNSDNGQAMIGVMACDFRNNREQEVNGTLQAKPGGA